VLLERVCQHLRRSDTSLCWVACIPRVVDWLGFGALGQKLPFRPTIKFWEHPYCELIYYTSVNGWLPYFALILSNVREAVVLLVCCFLWTEPTLEGHAKSKCHRDNKKNVSTVAKITRKIAFCLYRPRHGRHWLSISGKIFCPSCPDHWLCHYVWNATAFKSNSHQQSLTGLAGH
jgi:hypothetical protein